MPLAPEQVAVVVVPTQAALPGEALPGGRHELGEAAGVTSSSEAEEGVPTRSTEQVGVEASSRLPAVVVAPSSSPASWRASTPPRARRGGPPSSNLFGFPPPFRAHHAPSEQATETLLNRRQI